MSDEVHRWQTREIARAITTAKAARPMTEAERELIHQCLKNHRRGDPSLPLEVAAVAAERSTTEGE